MSDEEFFKRDDLDARRLPKAVVKTERRKGGDRYYPELMTSFGQFSLGKGKASYEQAFTEATRVTEEAKAAMEQALRDFVQDNGYPKAKP